MFHRTKLRSAVIGACTAALVVGAGLFILPAQAQAQAPSQQAVSAATARMSSRAEMQVASFFQDYQDAVQGIEHGGKTPVQVREEYLTTELDDALTAWASEHQTDPVLRKQELPKTWSTTESTSTATHTKIIITERWADGTSQDVWYQVRLSDMVIDSLTDPTPAPAA
ncbi:hypothetical protein [Streptomyces sp. RKAG293]|uniref:hypothetical protein n=1 Tax=Streptomyces sp. RKAG293 TaxID=2893403 RepID=UPI0020343F8F|nr:hypothetical protein [Streptomyces sp. RKAG293]MCM2421134.1 hypothetical protein [Streptomyces sp. RKAG293]